MPGTMLAGRLHTSVRGSSTPILRRTMTRHPHQGEGNKEPSSHFVPKPLGGCGLQIPAQDPLAPRHPADTWFLVPGYENRAVCTMVTSPTSQGSSTGSPGGCWTEHVGDTCSRRRWVLRFRGSPRGAGRASTEHSRQ